ncbi:MAG: hypothetical protein OXQ29_09550 [Rhodospirillaceae bacterium]|nr:hypothetical protein [Rhodospirillaceae bacterium]
MCNTPSHVNKPAPDGNSSGSDRVPLEGIIARGRRWLILYQVGTAAQALFGFGLIMFRRELGISEQFVFAIVVVSVALWLAYSFWLAQVVLHSFSKAFWFVGLATDEPESPWFQITPPWLRDYEDFLEANAHALLLQAALRGALIYIHQIPNHLQVLEASLSVAMRSQHTFADDTRRALDASTSEVRRLSDFIISLRAFVDGDTRAQEPFDIWKTVCLIGDRHAKAPEIIVDPSIEGPMRAVGCEPMVQQVLANVINNAGRYGKGIIFVTCRQSAGPQRQLEVLVYDGGDDLTNEEERLAFRVDPRIIAAGPHMRLGLPLSRHLMRHQGGDLRFVRADQHGRGKGVCISLPVG